jgi:hypothetical protein
MKKWTALVILGVSLVATLPAHSRNVRYLVGIAAVMDDPDLRGKVDGSVKFFFGPQASPTVLQKIATMSSDGDGTIVDKFDLGACKNAFASALLALQKNAKGFGANAVVNITSSFKKGPLVSSATEFVCHAGRSAAYLTLTGDIVKIADK